MKRKLFGVVGTLAVLLVFSLGLAGCMTTTYASVETTAIAEQIKVIQFHEMKPGETVKELEIERTGSLQVDFSKYEGGTWYSSHEDKIVAIEALQKTQVNPIIAFAPRSTAIWRIQYVD